MMEHESHRKWPDDYNVVVAGAGAVFNEKLEEALYIFGPQENRIVLDWDITNISSINNPHRLLADASRPPITLQHLPPERRQAYIAVVATPNHLEATRGLVNSGFQRIIAEKPLVNNGTEASSLLQILQENPDIKIYPLDFYVQKTIPLQALTGALTPDDPRWDWIEMSNGNRVDSEFSGSMKDHIGHIEGIDIAIVEGGSFGLPDLERRKWLEEDELRGGMLLDLGTHALAPLFAAGIGKAEDITVATASRYVLADNRRSFVTATQLQPEIFANALLSLRRNEKNIPVTVTVGKTFHDGGVWKLVIRGTKGDIAMGLRSGQHLTIQSNNNNQDIQLSLRKGKDPYALAFQEARMFFAGRLDSERILQPMIDAILVIDKIKQVSNEK